MSVRGEDKVRKIRKSNSNLLDQGLDFILSVICIVSQLIRSESIKVPCLFTPFHSWVLALALTFGCDVSFPFLRSLVFFLF